jgi:hypothetical protein
MFLGGNDQEEDGFIQKYWKAHEADISESLDIVMDTIEDMLEEDAPPHPAASAQSSSSSQAISSDNDDNLTACCIPRRKKRRQSSSTGTCHNSTLTTSEAMTTKTINEIFQAFQKEMKKREQVEEELRKCKRQLANLERVIYPRGIFEMDYDKYGKSSCPSVSQYGSELINERSFADMMETATSGYRHGFKKDVEKFIREFYGTYSGRVHNQTARVFEIHADDYNDLAELCGLCLIFHYFKRPFRYYSAGSELPSKCPFLP